MQYSDMEEVPLEGGNTNPSVVRIANTVRRATSPTSSTVHCLLQHLEDKHFEGSPRFLGIDTKGREILTYLSGEVGFLFCLWESDAPIIAAAQLLRQYHDATLDFTVPHDANWGYVYPDPSRHEVICHNDFAPYNVVCVDGLPYAMLDFDMAGPGPRLRDIAYAVFWYVPLATQGDMAKKAWTDRENGSSRLHLFCKSYGISPTSALMDEVESVLHHMAAWLIEQAEQGNVSCKRMIQEGHLADWRNQLKEFKAVRPLLEENIKAATGQS